GARAAGLHALNASAPGHAEAVLLAAIDLVAVAAAAVAGGVAAHRLELADGTVGSAALRIAAHTHVLAGLLHAGDRLRRGTRHAFRAAAIAVLRARIADDAAAARGLADKDARRSPRSAGAAAALAAAGRDASVIGDGPVEAEL